MNSTIDKIISSDLNSLPIELKVKIINYLDLNDLIQLSLVNSSFNLIIKYYKSIDNLVIKLEKYKIDGNNKWLKTDYLFNESYKLNLKRSNIYFFKTNFMRIILSELKRLCIDCDKLTDLKIDNIDYLNQFNQFKKLENLSIHDYSILRYSILKLENLKYLTLDNCVQFRNQVKLGIKCSKLEFFCSENNLAKLRFIYPKNIKHLYLDRYETNLKKFKNLEQLTIADGSSLNFDIFNEFESLDINLITFDDNHKLINLIKRKLLLKSDIKFYLYGWRIDDLDNLKTITDNRDVNWCPCCFSDTFENIILLKQNYSKLIKQNDFKISFKYDDLLRCFNTIPADFFTKFSNITTLSINGKNIQLNQDLVIDFLKNCRSLTNLIIDNVKFKQLFYDNLNIWCRNLRFIELKNIKLMIDHLKFLFKHPQIEFLKIDQHLPIDLLSKLIKESIYLRLINLEFDNIEIEIRYCKVHEIYHLEILDKTNHLITEQFRYDFHLIDYLEQFTDYY